MAGAFHGVGEADSVINVGVSGPGVVYHALQKCKGEPFDVVAETDVYKRQEFFRRTRRRKNDLNNSPPAGGELCEAFCNLHQRSESI